MADPLGRAREEAARSADPPLAERGVARFAEAAGPRAAALLARDGAPRALATLLALGEFPSAALARDPAALAFAMDGPLRPPAAAVEGRLRRDTGGKSGAAYDLSLRLARRREILRILLADAGGGAPLEDAAGALSDLAGAVIRTVLDRELAAAAERDGPPLHEDGSPAAVACIAMGKLGGAELNYSSDVDLLFVRSGDGRCRPRDGSPGRGLLEHFADAASATARSLSRRTGEGHLYRVDLRLRPRGTAGALVPPVAGAVHYYRSLGRGWERQALLKARPVAGDLALGAELLSGLEPWVFGRPLLSGEIAEIRRLKRTIEESPGAAAGNLKTGPGGIRDVEYVVQFLQLLLGAEHPSVRTGNTLEGLRRLGEAKALSEEEAGTLSGAYVFLRTAEHRLQAADDAQVHTLPADEEGLASLARRMGLGAGGRDAAAEFREIHARHAAGARAVLERIVHNAFAAEEEKARRVVDLLLAGGEAPPAAVAEALGPFGFRDPAAAFADLRRMAQARSPWLPRTRTYFASAAPAVLSRAALTPDPDRALSLLQRLAERAAGSGLFFRLLTENPDVLGVFCDLGGYSPVLADLLWSRPAIMDAFLDSLVVAPGERLPPVEDLPLSAIESSPDPAAALRDLRDLAVLRVATRELQGGANARQTAQGLSDAAEAIVRLAAGAAAAREAGRGEGPPPGRFAVLALGRLGAREMAYGSDVDLLFLHDGSPGDCRGLPGNCRAALGQPDPGTLGQPDPGASERFARLARELLAILSGGGDPVVRVDLGLRPEGGKGTLTASLPGFLRYLRERGRTWERQALVRARAVGGDAGFGREALDGIARVLFGEPPVPGIAAEVREMRARVEAAADPGCLKGGRGGLRDAEFLAQALVLVHGHAHPAVRAPNTVDALSALRDAGALAAEEHEGIVTAYLFLRTVELRLRLSSGAPGSVLPKEPAGLDALARRLGYVDTAYASAGTSLGEEVAYYRERLRTWYGKVMGREC
jgi:glutamate-ammonia-ligase adenylyltransferase